MGDNKHGLQEVWREVRGPHEDILGWWALKAAIPSAQF